MYKTILNEVTFKTIVLASVTCVKVPHSTMILTPELVHFFVYSQNVVILQMVKEMGEKIGLNWLNPPKHFNTVAIMYIYTCKYFESNILKILLSHYN